MDHKHVYDSLINRSKFRLNSHFCVVEKHHIMPRSMGGSDDKSNIAFLSPREHFIAHWLLTKFTEDEDKKKMYFAFWMMSNHKKYGRLNSYSYQKLKERFSTLISISSKKNRGKKHNEETKKKLSEAAKKRTGELNAFYGKKHSEESRKKMKVKRHTDEAKKKISEALKGKKRKPLSEETKKKIGRTRKRLYEEGLQNPFKGKKHNEEWKKQASTRNKLRWAKWRLEHGKSTREDLNLVL